jgi:hypothetical protein
MRSKLRRCAIVFASLVIFGSAGVARATQLNAHSLRLVHSFEGHPAQEWVRIKLARLPDARQDLWIEASTGPAYIEGARLGIGQSRDLIVRHLKVIDWGERIGDNAGEFPSLVRRFLARESASTLEPDVRFYFEDRALRTGASVEGVRQDISDAEVELEFLELLKQNR